MLKQNKFNKNLSTELIVIQPTGFCNISCNYCYLPSRDNKRILSHETLNNIFREIFNSPYTGKEITIVWHCGEPLSVPLRFYETAFSNIEKLNMRGIKVTNSFQTNGTLIDDNWCKFFKKNNVNVGISIDGPMKYHDANRVTRNGHGTFEKTIRGVSLLKKNKINFHIITVLTKDTVDKPDLLWGFYINNGMNKLAFNVEEIDGVNSFSSLAGSADRHKIKCFFKRLLELRASHHDYIYIRELESMENKIRFERIDIALMESTPLSIISFDCNGNMSTFSPELLTMTDRKYGNFIFGNVNNDSLNSIIASKKFKVIYNEINKGIDQCSKSCEYFEICGGGAPSNKLFENGVFDSSETMYCNNHIKAVADAVIEHLEENANINAEAL